MPKQNKTAGGFYPSALTIAGSDSGGGAGIQADLRTFNAFGVFGCCAIAALTSQNPAEVRRVDPAPPEAVSCQIDAVMAKIAVRWAKSGMLFDSNIVAAVAAAVRKHHLKLVCDPVMVATSGAPLLRSEAVSAVRDLLLPEAEWITPNLPEAELLAGRKLASMADYEAAAQELAERWQVAVLLKTGHDERSERACDVVCKGGRLYHLESPRLEVPPLAAHGTGCTLSSALAAALALELPWKQALCEAKAFVLGSLRENVRLGADVYGMYPPVEDSIGDVKLTEVAG